MLFAGCAVWLAMLGWIDRATGYELGLFAFYTAPVAVVAWNLGQEFVECKVTTAPMKYVPPELRLAP